MFENTPLARRLWTGLDDEHLASIGFVNFAWNALERKFASLVWVTAGWKQEAGELVVAGMGNVSLVSLFLNLLKQELNERDDRRLWEHGERTGVLFNTIRDARNDLVHTFFHWDPTSGAEGHFKGSPRKSRTGQAEIRAVAMAKSDIDELCCAVSDCFESIDDLILKIWFGAAFSVETRWRPRTPTNMPSTAGRTRLSTWAGSKSIRRSAPGRPRRGRADNRCSRRRKETDIASPSRDRSSGSPGRVPRAPKVLCRWRKSLSAVQSPLPPCGRAVGGEGRSRQGARPDDLACGATVALRGPRHAELAIPAGRSPTPA